MNKEEILMKSRKENEGKPDELEIAAFGKAARVGMLTGGSICIVLILVSRWILNRPEIALAGWTIFCSMQAGSNIVMYKHLKTSEKLVSAIINTVFAVGFAAALVIAIVKYKMGT